MYIILMIPKVDRKPNTDKRILEFLNKKAIET